jgi:hypothetical protein
VSNSSHGGVLGVSFLHFDKQRSLSHWSPIADEGSEPDNGSCYTFFAGWRRC